MNIRDYALGVVVTPPDPKLSGTSLTLRENDGSVMPPAPFKATVAPPGEFPTLANAEQVLVTDRTGDTVTIERAQGETTAKEIDADWIFANPILAEDTLGKNNARYNEPAVGDVDGSNTTFTVDAGQYVAGTLIVTVNGLVQKRTTHYVETTPSSGTFAMATAPHTGDNVQVSYDATESTRGNAQTLQGKAASEFLSSEPGSVTADALADDAKPRIATGIVNGNAATRVIDTLDFEPREIEFMHSPHAETASLWCYGRFIAPDINFGFTNIASSSNWRSRFSTSNSLILVSASAGTLTIEGTVTATSSDGFTVSFSSPNDRDFRWIARA